MLDRTIPFFNTILRCDHYRHRDPVLPEGFTITAYKPGYEKAWAELECSIEDFGSLEEAEQYFTATYLQDPSRLDKLLFAVNPEGSVVGTCIAWQDLRGDAYVSSLHWLVVDEAYQGMGIGRALCHGVMNIYESQNHFPVYIHTQPWSWKAVFLYLSLGFRLQKTDAFSHYVNEYSKAMDTLKQVVTPEQFHLLQEFSDP